MKSIQMIQVEFWIFKVNINRLNQLGHAHIVTSSKQEQRNFIWKWRKGTWRWAVGNWWIVKTSIRKRFPILSLKVESLSHNIIIFPISCYSSHNIHIVLINKNCWFWSFHFHIFELMPRISFDIIQLSWFWKHCP